MADAAAAAASKSGAAAGTGASGSRPAQADGAGASGSTSTKAASPAAVTKPTPPAANDVEEDEDEDEVSGPVEAPASSEGIIDEDVFSQIRDMDEEDEDDEDGDPHGFSRGIVWGYFEQAEETFGRMKRALEIKDLGDLSGLGHFLKGSSAALGIIKVQASCEKMQHYGACRDEEAGEALSEEEALRRIAALLKVCRKDYEVAKAWMMKLYSEM